MAETKGEVSAPLACKFVQTGPPDEDGIFYCGYCNRPKEDHANHETIPILDHDEIEMGGGGFVGGGEGTLPRVHGLEPETGQHRGGDEVMIVGDNFVVSGHGKVSDLVWAKWGEFKIDTELVNKNTLRCFSPPKPGDLTLMATHTNRVSQRQQLGFYIEITCDGGLSFTKDRHFFAYKVSHSDGQEIQSMMLHWGGNYDSDDVNPRPVGGGIGHPHASPIVFPPRIHTEIQVIAELLDILSRGDPYLLRFDAATTGEGLFNFLRWVAANHPTNSDPKRLMQLCASAWFEHLLNVTKEEIGDLVVLLDTAHHHDQTDLAGDGESKDAGGGARGGRRGGKIDVSLRLAVARARETDLELLQYKEGEQPKDNDTSKLFQDLRKEVEAAVHGKGTPIRQVACSDSYALVLLENGSMYIKDIKSAEKDGSDVWCDDVATPSDGWQWPEGNGKKPQCMMSTARQKDGENFRCKEWRIESNVPALDVAGTDARAMMKRFFLKKSQADDGTVSYEPDTRARQKAKEKQRDNPGKRLQDELMLANSDSQRMTPQLARLQLRNRKKMNQQDRWFFPFCNTPRPPPVLVKMVACGGAHFCAITDRSHGSKLFTWGSNADGQLGYEVDTATKKMQRGDVATRQANEGPRLVKFFDGIQRDKLHTIPRGQRTGMRAVDMLASESSVQPMMVTTVACGPHHTVCSAVGSYDGISRIFAWGAANAGPAADWETIPCRYQDTYTEYGNMGLPAAAARVLLNKPQSANGVMYAETDNCDYPKTMPFPVLEIAPEPLLYSEEDDDQLLRFFPLKMWSWMDMEFTRWHSMVRPGISKFMTDKAEERSMAGGGKGGAAGAGGGAGTAAAAAARRRKKTKLRSMRPFRTLMDPDELALYDSIQLSESLIGALDARIAMKESLLTDLRKLHKIEDSSTVARPEDDAGFIQLNAMLEEGRSMGNNLKRRNMDITVDINDMRRRIKVLHEESAENATMETSIENLLMLRSTGRAHNPKKKKEKAPAPLTAVAVADDGFGEEEEDRPAAVEQPSARAQMRRSSISAPRRGSLTGVAAGAASARGPASASSARQPRGGHRGSVSVDDEEKLSEHHSQLDLEEITTEELQRRLTQINRIQASHGNVIGNINRVVQKLSFRSKEIQNEIETLDSRESVLSALHDSWRSVEAGGDVSSAAMGGISNMEKDMHDLELFWRGLTDTTLESIAERQIQKGIEAHKKSSGLVDPDAEEADYMEVTDENDKDIHHPKFSGVQGMVQYSNRELGEISLGLESFMRRPGAEGGGDTTLQLLRIILDNHQFCVHNNVLMEGRSDQAYHRLSNGLATSKKTEKLRKKPRGRKDLQSKSRNTYTHSYEFHGYTESDANA